MVVFNTVEFALQLSDFRAVSIHLVIGTRPIFVDLINDKRGVIVYQEAFNTKFDSNAETHGDKLCTRRHYWRLENEFGGHIGGDSRMKK